MLTQSHAIFVVPAQCVDFQLAEMRCHYLRIPKGFGTQGEFRAFVNYSSPLLLGNCQTFEGYFWSETEISYQLFMRLVKDTVKDTNT